MGRGALTASAALSLAALTMLGGATQASAANKEETLCRFGAAGAGAGEFDLPTGFGADPKTGHVLVNDEGNRIDEFTPWCEFVKSFGWDVAPGAVNEVQEARVRADEGAFKLGFEGDTTADLPFDAAAPEVQGALNGLGSIEGPGGAVSVAARLGGGEGATPFVYRIVFKGALAGTDVPQIEAEEGSEPLGGGDPETELEARTIADGTPGGEGLESCTGESGCQAGIRGTRAGQMDPHPPAVGAGGDLYVNDSFTNIILNPPIRTTRIQQFDSAGRFVRIWGGDVIRDGAAGTGTVSPGSAEVTGVSTTEKAFRVGQPIEATGIEAGTTIETLGAGTIILSEPAGAAASGAPTALTVPPGPNDEPANEVQTVALGEGTTGGDFTLTFKTPNPSPSEASATEIPYNATAAELEAKLNALANMGALGGEVSVSGPEGGPWEIEFEGTRYANSDVEEMSADGSGLLGSKAVTIASANQGEICEVADECQAGARGTAPGQFGNGVAVALAPGGATLYGASGGPVQEFTPEGEFLGEMPDPDGIVAKGRLGALSPQSGHLFFTASGEEDIYELDPATGEEVRTLQIERPAALAAGPEGHLYAVNEGRATRPEHVIEFGPAGEQLEPPRAQEEECEELESAEEEGYEELCLTLGIQPEEGFKFRGLGAGSAGDLYAVNRKGGGAGLENFAQAYGPPPFAFEAPPPAPPQIVAQFAVSVGASEAELRAQVNPHFAPDTRYYLQYGTGKCSEGGCPSTKPAPPGALLTEAFTEAPLATDSVFLEGLAPGATYHYRFVAQSSGGGPVFGVGEGEAEATFTTARAPGEGGSCPNEALRAGPAALLPDCRAYELVSPTDKEGEDVLAANAEVNEASFALRQAASTGERLAYPSRRAFADAPGAPAWSQYIAARGAGGWSTHSVDAPVEAPLSDGVEGRFGIEFEAFSPDLCQGWLARAFEPTLSADAPPGYQDLYRRADELCGGPAYEALSAVTPPDIEPPGAFKMKLQGLSADGSVAAFLANDRLAAGAAGETRQLYARAAGGPPRLACVLPSGAAAGPCTAGWEANAGVGPHARLDGALSSDGAKLYWTEGFGSGRIYERLNPLAPESARSHGSAAGQGDLIGPATGKGRAKGGEAVLTGVEVESGAFAVGQEIEDEFERIPPGTTIEECLPDCENPTELRLSAAATGSKVNDPLTGLASEVAHNVATEAGAFQAGQEISAPGIAPGTTIESVSEAEATLTLSAPAAASEAQAPLEAISPCTEAATKACTAAVSEGAARFVAGSQSGARALYEEGGSLYEFTLGESGEGASTPIAGRVLGTMGASVDATRAYFASEEDLTPGKPNSEGSEAQEDEPNLYLYDATKAEGERYSFVAGLQDPEDLGGSTGGSPSPLSPRPGRRTSRVGADGLHAVFMSFAQQTGYDNTDSASGRRDSEVYLYDASANGGQGELLCASCRPSGARPRGRVVADAYANTKFGIAAQVPVADNDLHASRLISADGRRLYFESVDPLVARDSNGAYDVYQWEAPGKGTCSASSPAYSAANEGCIDLISSGQSPRDSELLDTDPSGDDVFFATLSSLVASDYGLVDVYDARAGGGFPAPPAPPAACQGEACQSPPPAPEAPEPASGAYRGPGNLSQGRSCAKHSRRARKLSGRAGRLRRNAQRAGNPRKAKRMRRKSTRLAKRARGASKRAKRCRQTKKRGRAR